MSEMAEFWNAVKAERAISRRNSAQKAAEEFALFQEAAAPTYELLVKSETHWNVVKKSTGRVVAQYWPSSNKWQILKSGKIRNGNHEQFRAALRRESL